MKRNLIILAVIIALCLCGCGKVDTESIKDTDSTKDVDGAETVDRVEDVDNTENVDGKKDIVGIGYSTVEPNYDYQLFMSDDIIVGEVIEELDRWFTNPDGEIKELMNAELTPYKVRVDKSYKGLFKEGDIIIADVWNIYPVYAGRDDIEITGANDYYLHEGQRGVFMLEETQYVKSKENETMYHPVFGEESVFEPKETGTANMGEEAKQIYASPSLEITLDQIPDDIKSANEKLRDVNYDENIF